MVRARDERRYGRYTSIVAIHHHTACSNGSLCHCSKNSRNSFFVCSLISSTFLWAKVLFFWRTVGDAQQNPEPPARSSQRLAVGTVLKSFHKKYLLSRRFAYFTRPVGLNTRDSKPARLIFWRASFKFVLDRKFVQISSPFPKFESPGVV